MGKETLTLTALFLVGFMLAENVFFYIIVMFVLVCYLYLAIVRSL